MGAKSRQTCWYRLPLISCMKLGRHLSLWVLVSLSLQWDNDLVNQLVSGSSATGMQRKHGSKRWPGSIIKGDPRQVHPGSEFQLYFTAIWAALSLSNSDTITERGQIFNHLTQSLAHELLFYYSCLHELLIFPITLFPPPIFLPRIPWLALTTSLSFFNRVR